MLLTITTTHTPASDLGYLLHKHPQRLHSFPLNFGMAHVFYPEATSERCTAALLLEVDPIGLVRGNNNRTEARNLTQYVNDRPYVASSYLSVALAQVFGSAMSGTSRERPELTQTPIPLEICLQVVPCRAGEAFLRGLFEPLGYQVEAEGYALDSHFPEWGDSPYFTLRLKQEACLSDALKHLYVLIPTLDMNKHYAIGDAEVEKLIRQGEGWLATHPMKETIVRRYLKQRRSLVREALEQLLEVEEEQAENAEAEKVEPTKDHQSLHEQRLSAVLIALLESGAETVLDLGCGEGRLLKLLLKEKQFKKILGMDVSYTALEKAQDSLHWDQMPTKLRERIDLIHGSLIYRDRRLENYDAAAIVEVIEHLEPARLTAFERVVFGYARPTTVVITTPNSEFNPKYPSLPAGGFRHADHRFEWTRAEFSDWVSGICGRYGYTANCLPVGEEDAEVGAPSQMAVFRQTQPEGSQ